jgi:hypothetical protein
LAVLLLGWDKLWVGSTDLIPFAYGAIAIIALALPVYGLVHLLLRRGDSTGPSALPSMAGLVTVFALYGVALVPTAFVIFAWLSQFTAPSELLEWTSLCAGALVVAIASSMLVLAAIVIRRRALTARWSGREQRAAQRGRYAARATRRVGRVG